MFANASVVEHGSEGSGVSATWASGAGAAVVGGFVWVVEADGSVSEDEDDIGEVGDESDIPEGAFGGVDHFGECEADAIFVRSGGCTFGAFESEACDSRWCDDAAGGAIDAGCVSGEEYASEEWNGGEWSEEGGEECPGDG